MATIRSAAAREKLRQAGRLAAALRAELGRRIGPGVTTRELDRYAEEYMIDRGALPALKGYRDYPYAICASVNDAVCHGLPGDTPLQAGDLVKLDFALAYGGWMADTCWTYGVGTLKPEAARLRRAAYRAMMRSVEKARPGAAIGDLSWAAQRSAMRDGCAVVASFGGHGIGRRLHEPPEIPFVGWPGTGPIIKEGTALTVEPMLTLGPADVYVDGDGWTVRTVSGGWAAQFEHTVLVTAAGPLIATR